ncbi:MAG: hypothetical protein V7K57_28425 [Nostoc sp.]
MQNHLNFAIAYPPKLGDRSYCLCDNCDKYTNIINKVENITLLFDF